MATPNVQRTGNRALAREINLAAIMNHLHNHTPISHWVEMGKRGQPHKKLDQLLIELLLGVR